MNRFAVAIVLAVVAGIPNVQSFGQTETRGALTAKQREFRRAVRSGIQEDVRLGIITRGQASVLRTALWSPSFVRKAEMLALVEMATSGHDSVPFNTAGEIDRTAIDWEGLTEFIKALIPLLLELLLGLGIGGETSAVDGGAAVTPPDPPVENTSLDSLDFQDWNRQINGGGVSFMPALAA